MRLEKKKSPIRNASKPQFLSPKGLNPFLALSAILTVNCFSGFIEFTKQ